MKTKLLLTSFAALAFAIDRAPAQAQDVGLTMDGGILTVIYGQDCGPVTCTPMIGGAVGQGQSRTLVHYSEPQSLYAIAIGFPGPCVAIPGFDNALLLSSPLILGFGLTSSPPFVPLPCQQGIANESFTIPPNAPIGVVFRVQSLGVSPSSGVLAFSPAIEATIL
jgi:hypothetical protein